MSQDYANVSALIPPEHKTRLLEAGSTYLRMGWKLCAISGRLDDGVTLSKAPQTGRWNTESEAIDTPERLETVLESGRVHGLGLLHAFSGTCCIDIDDLKRSAQYFLENFNLDIYQFINSGVVWHRGDENKLKLLYKTSPRKTIQIKIPHFDDEGLPVVNDQGTQKQINIFEFRCASSSDGKSVQDVLPPSIHPSGAYYEWKDPEYFADIPNLPSQLEIVWEKLGGVEKKSGFIEEDPIARQLVDRELVIDSAQGKLFILCPFRENHSTQDSVSSCTYLLPHYDGHNQGNFKCLHASCADRTNDEFLEKLGMSQSDEALRLDLALKRKKAATLYTATEILMLHGRYKGIFQFNELTRTIERKPSDLDKIIPRHPSGTLRNEDITALSLDMTRLAGASREWSREILKHAVDMVSKQHTYNPARSNLLHYKSKWDGVPRIENWFIEQFGATVDQGQNVFPNKDEEREYLHLVSKFFFIGLVARAFSPGVKQDCMLILEGEQGIGKSTFVEKLANCIYPNSYVSLLDLASYKEFGMHIKGKIIVEVSELHALKKSEATHLKALLSMSSDRYRELWAIDTNDVPRSCVFVGTTNEVCGKYLTDTTGNRRYWRMVVNRQLDLSRFEVEMPQLLGEATARFLTGERWHAAEPREMTLLSRGIAIAMVGEPWEDILAIEIPRKMAKGEFLGNRQWVQREDRYRDTVVVGKWPDRILSSEVCDILGIPTERRSKRVYMELTRIMGKLGYVTSYFRLSKTLRGNGFQLNRADFSKQFNVQNPSVVEDSEEDTEFF